MAQYAIMRFAKQKGGGARALEAHHERQKDKYASNPDINIERSKFNFHIVRTGCFRHVCISVGDNFLLIAFALRPKSPG